jgi:hypothetical protein
MSGNLAYRKSIVPEGETVVALTHDKAQRDSEVLRLWEAKWSARKIAEYLGIKSSTVVYIIHKNGRARKPRGARNTIIVSLQDAPIEAWQQAMLPNLEQGADAFGMKDSLKRAFVFVSLLRLKRYERIPS